MAYDPSRASPTVKEPKAQSDITLDALLDEFEVSDPAVRDRVLRLAGVESSGNLNATGPRVNGGMHNGTRARGALQIMPATAKAYPQYDLNDPADATRAGLHYFLDNLNQFGGDLDAATIAHHAGPGTARKWLREGRAGTVDRATGLSTDDYLLKVTGGKRAKPADKWWENDPVAPAEAAGNWWESDPVEPAEEPGLLERGWSALKDTFSAPSGEPVDVRPHPGEKAPAAAKPDSVMADYQGEQSARQTPANAQTRAFVQQQYDAHPEKREAMLSRPDWLGDIARQIDAEYQAMNPAEALKPFDQRREARFARNRAQGMDPATAEMTTASQMIGGEAPVGSIKVSDFDFDLKQRYEGATPALRGAVKGYEGYKQGVLGFLQAGADLVGADFASGQFRQGAREAAGQAAAIGEGEAGARLFEGAVASLTQQLPLLIGGSIAGGQALILSGMAAQAFGQEYSEGRQAGLDGQDAATRASLFAAFEVIGEKFGLGNQLAALKMAYKGVPTKQLAAELGAALAKEIPGEVLTTTGQFLTDKAPQIGLNPEAGMAQYLSQVADTIGQTIIQGGLMMGGASAVSRGARAMQRPEPDLTAGMQFDPRVNDALARQALDPSNAQETANVAPPLDAASYQGPSADPAGGAGLAPDGRVGAGGTSGATGAPARSGEPGVSVGEAERQQVAGVVEQKIAEKEAEAAATGDPIELLVTRAEGAAMRRAVTPQPANGIDIDQDALLADVEAMFTESGNLMVQGDNAREAVKRIDPKAIASALPRGDGALLVPQRFAGPVMDALQGAKQRVSVAFGGDGMMQAPDVAQFRATVPTQEEVQDVPKAEQVAPQATEARGQEGAAENETPRIRRAKWRELGSDVSAVLPPDASRLRPQPRDFIAAAKSLSITPSDAALAWNVFMHDDTPTPRRSSPSRMQPTQAPTAPEQSNPAPAQTQAADKPKRKAPARKPDPVTVDRAQRNAEDLRAMAQDAGWAEEGGKLIRDAEGNASRTKWIPRAQWFMTGMESRPDVLAQHIEAAARGEWIPVKSARTIEGMVEWLDAQRGQATLDEDASMYDFEASFGDVLDVPDAREVAEFFDDTFGDFAEQSEADAMRALGFTEEEIANAGGQTQAGAGSAEATDARGTAEPGERAGEAGTAQEEAGQGQQEGLNAQQRDEQRRAQAVQALAPLGWDVSEGRAEKTFEGTKLGSGYNNITKSTLTASVSGGFINLYSGWDRIGSVAITANMVPDAVAAELNKKAEAWAQDRKAAKEEREAEYPFGRVANGEEDRFFRSRVRVMPEMAGDVAWEGEVGSVLNGGRLIDVKRDGQDFRVRISGDRIEVLDRVDSREQQSVTPKPSAAQQPAQTSRPDPGRYIQPKGDGSVQQQTALANRGATIAALTMMNNAAGKPYSDDEIQNVADDRIDALRDYLSEQARTKPMLQSNGKPFPSEKLAAESARQRKLDMVPVEVDGGWGLAEKPVRMLNAEGRATDGKPIMPGDTFPTLSGRMTTPYPKQKGEKYASQWLIDNAKSEAESRGDDYNLRMFGAITLLKGGFLTEADKDMMLMYLFEQQPDVVPGILRPLNASAEPLTLDTYTNADIAQREAEQTAQAEAEAKAERDAAAKQRQAEERAEVRRRSEAAADTFELGMDPMENLTGQGGLFGQADSAPQPARPAAPAASANTIFTEDAAEKARALLRRKLGQLNSGVDPEMLQAGITLAGYHIEKGARSFAAYARAMLGDLGDAVRPYLKSWYVAIAFDPRARGFDGMDNIADVQATDENADFIGMAQQEQGNGTDERGDSGVEPDRRNAEAQDGVGEEGIRAEPGRDAAGRGQGVQGARAGGGARRSGELSGREAAPARERGDLTVYTGATDVPGSATRSDLDRRSADPGLDGAPIEPDAAKTIEAAARGGSRLAATKAAQAEADATPHGNSLEDIRAALPALLPGQQEDVFKAEQRFAKPDGYGMLFTNGTGTGKTFTGLGIVKRFALAGKTNTLIVAPNDKIIEDWQKSGRVLGLEIARLQDTNDAGAGIVITTYANFGDNAAIASREWDLVVSDESHYLMQDKDGTPTSYLRALRAITLHPDGVYRRHEMLNGDEIAERNRLAADAKMLRTSDDERQWAQAEEVQDKADALSRKLDEKFRALEADVKARQGATRPRAVFLSATPFAYEKTIDWANGYLFDYNEGQPSEAGTFRGYNDGGNRERFFMQHLGYRMRYNKLTQPDAKVDSGLMQRQFNGWLKKKGSLSGRMLEVPFDYDRRFILVDSAIGTRIDAALTWLREEGGRIAEAGGDRRGVDALKFAIDEKFDYLSRRYLLEAIKAAEVIPHVREHLAMGRKVVVFHDYKKGGGFNPFVQRRLNEGGDDADAAAARKAYNAALDAFNRQFADLIGSDIAKMPNPIEAFQRAFPDVLLFNGNVPKQQRSANVAKFQDDASGPQVILVQSAAGKEGVSLHDTTGKYQRVLFNLGQPTQPTTAIQQEGRIYRTGQQSDAIIRYLNTGTNWEKWAFATTIAQRASAAENLGAGEQARALKDAFIQGFEESDNYRAGMEGEGTGGKERDRLANEAISEYDRAKAYYFGQQKKTSKTKAQEGADYFATPEPVGLKMVEWADIRPGERALEPSAGHGAIARWMPENAERTAIEPSSTLLPRLAMVFDGKIQDTTFEALNVVNKFDAIVMNPPFGSGGKTAIEHVAKAATHLREKGRIVALIPTGPAADKRFEKWFYETEERPVRPIVQHDFGTGPIAIYRGDTVRSRAAWAPEAIVMRKSESGGLWVKVAGTPGETQITLQSLTGHTNTGPRTETVRPAEGLHLIADIKMPGVTFERAGTRVATRIVVIEKQSDPAVAQNLAERQRDYTGVEDIGELFDRLEDLMLPKRTGVVEADAAPADRAEQASGRSKPKAANPGAVGTVERQGLPIVEHTTAKGKVIRGVIRTDLSKEQAQKIDPYTWKKDGGFFIREQYLKPEGDAPAMSRASGQETAPAMTRSALVQSISSRFPSLTSAVESALRRGDEGKPGGVVVVERAEDLARMFAEKTGRSMDDAVQSLGSTDGRDVNGLFDSRSGLTFLVAPNLTERTAPAVLLHEATHGKQRAEIDRKAMDLIETRQARSKPLRDFLFRVEQRMEAAGESGNATEAAAYIVEEAVVAGRQAGFSAVDGKLMNWIDLKFGRRVSDIVRDFVAMIRAWAMRAGVELNPTVDDLVAIAKLNVRDMARGDVTGGEGAKESRASQTEAFKRLADLLGGASAARDMLSSGSQSIVDGLKRDAEMISNLLESQSIGSELNSLGDVPLSVVPHVLNVTDDEKVLRAVVRSLPVDVMDFFARKKLSPKKVLSNKAMLEEVLSVDSKTSVPLGVNKSIARSLVGSVARAAAEISGLAGGPLKFNTASFTGANNTIFGAQDNLINEGLGDAKDITKTENFLNWFGDSKVVDENGQPLVVYHGTGRDFDAFSAEADPSHLPLPGFYFTPHADSANNFAESSAKMGELKAGRSFEPIGANVIPAFLSIQNPFVEDLTKSGQGGFYPASAIKEMIEYARAKGHDGVILKGWQDGSGPIQYIAFRPNQVKSAVGNNGNFDPTDRRINFSRAGQATMNAPAAAAQPAQAAPRAAQARATPPDETRFQAFQRKAQDKLNRFTVIKEWLAAQGVTLSEQADVYKAEERMHSRFANKAEDFREKTVKPLVEKIQKAGFTMDDVAQYLHAQHAEERNIQVASINKQMPDGGSGMKTADANAILAQAPAELKRLANELRAITERTKQILLDNGIISQDMADAWDAAYQHYVPLKGGPEQGGKGAGKGLKANYKGKRALGHLMREEGEWIVENILADHERAIMLAEKNRIGQSLLKMAIEVGRDDLLTVGKPEKRGVLKNNTAYEVLFKGKVIGAFQSLEAARAFRATAPAAMKGASPSEFGIRKVSDPTVAYMASPMLADNEVNVYVRGQAIRVQINDDLLARAYGNMGTEALGAILRVGATINGYFSKIYTGYNPEFILTNIVRDFTTGVANVTGEEGAMMALRAAKDYPASFADLFRYATTGNASQWIRMYREDGGNTGAAYLSDLERLGDEISTEYAAYKGVLANLKAGDVKSAARAAGRKAFDKTLAWVERINQAGENAMRLSIYKAMIESGKSRAEAASLAKNATVNFNRNGEVGRQMNALWLFYNAGVQGTAAIAHANLKGRHKWQARAVSAGILGLGYTMAVALGAGDDEDEYDKLSDYTKARNVVMKTGDGWLKIPVPYGYGFFWNMGRAIADAERKGEWGRAPWHVASSFIEEFTPFGAAFAGDDLTLEQVTLGALPTLAQIPASVGMNRTTMGGPMYPESAFDKYQPDNEKMWRATKGTIPDMIAQALDQGGIEVSPETIKYLTRTFTGGAGQFVTSIGDAAWLTANGASLEVKEQPFVRKFYTETDVREARSAYYAAVAEAEKAVREGKSLLKMGDHAAYGAYRVENQEFYALDRMAKARAAAIKARRNYADAIRADKSLSVKEKRDKLKAAEAQEQVIYDRYLEVFKSRTRH